MLFCFVFYSVVFGTFTTAVLLIFTVWCVRREIKKWCSRRRARLIRDAVAQREDADPEVPDPEPERGNVVNAEVYPPPREGSTPRRRARPAADGDDSDSDEIILNIPPPAHSTRSKTKETKAKRVLFPQTAASVSSYFTRSKKTPSAANPNPSDSAQPQPSTSGTRAKLPRSCKQEQVITQQPTPQPRDELGLDTSEEDLSYDTIFQFKRKPNIVTPNLVVPPRK